MAIFKLGAMFDAISGKVGGQSLANYPQQQILRNITQTNKFATPKQSKKRAFTAYLANSWRQLTTAQQQGWSATAVNYTYVNRVGDTITRNGYQTFSFCNQNLNLIEIPTIQNAPAYVPVTEPKINIIDISSGNFEIQSNNSSSTYLYALFGVANLSPGQAPQLGMMRYIGEITSAQLAAGYDVVSDLEDVFGTLTFPNKMAITVDPINQTTGNRNQFATIIENVETPMILTLVVPSSTSVTIPFGSGGTYNGSIDWGDGTTTTFLTYNAAGCTHTYTLAGTYYVLIYGAFPRFYVNNGTFKSYLTNILQFGSNPFVILNFHGCALLTAVTPSDTPNLSSCTTLTRLFSVCSLMTSVNNINEWDTSTITIMSYCFSSTLFNQSLSNWDVSLVTNMDSLFDTSSFNQSLATWNAPLVTSLAAFIRSSLFNSPLPTFGAAKITSLNSFANNNDVFNQDVSAIDVSVCTNFAFVFNSCNAFNQSLAAWNVGAGTSFGSFAPGTVAWSVANWNATLVAWNALPSLQMTQSMSVRPTATGTGATARTNIIATYGWTISQGA